MTYDPQAIAREASEQIARSYLSKNGCPFPDMSDDEFIAFAVIDYAPIILTAAARMVRESGAREVLEDIPPQDPGDEQGTEKEWAAYRRDMEAWETRRAAALANLAKLEKQP